MQFLKKIFSGITSSENNTVIGLCAIRKNNNYIRISIPDNYKKTFIQNVQPNYLLF